MLEALLMKYSNIVKFIPKDGEFNQVIELLSQPMNVDGLLQNMIVQIDDRMCVAIGIWESEAHLVNARPKMIAHLDAVRDKLDIISDECGVTDPASGPVIFEQK